MNILGDRFVDEDYRPYPEPDPRDQSILSHITWYTGITVFPTGTIEKWTRNGVLAENDVRK